MKITLDHNCLIHLENKTDVGAMVETIVHSESHQCYIINIGASEMRKNGIRPDRYDLFKEMLIKLELDHLPRLNPLLFWQVTFWNHANWASSESNRLANDIRDILFGDAKRIETQDLDMDSKDGHKFINRVCDFLGLCSHIDNQNDVYLTSDLNYMKESKLPKLIELGAKRICTPNDFLLAA